MDNHSWCYPACSQCHKKTDIDTVPFTCGCGKHNDQPILRYRVEVMVKDKDEDTKFLLWDRECAEMIGQLADEVNRLKMEQSVSVTADHDPLLRVPLTPTKCLSADELDDEPRTTWRIFAFPIHARKPAVERLNFHLLGQHNVFYADDDDIDDILSKPSISDSKFLAWMNSNKCFPEGRNLTYSQFVSKFTFNQKTRSWQLRKKGHTIGRLIWIPPTTGELFYLRMMLTTSKGPTSFEDIRTVAYVIYPTYREACFAMGFLQDDREFVEAIKEAKDWGTTNYLRKLFVIMLLTGSITKPEELWNQTWHWLVEDIAYHYTKSIANTG
ncbi:hypothetical protein JHK85_010467 [Glycine max]|nr:hypothetical protein JHK85_010467 [Glycine max]